MAVDKKFFVDINLQGNALNNATIGSNSDMTKGGSFQYNGTRLEYYNGSVVQQVADLSDISAVTGGLIFQGGYDPTTNIPNIADGTAKKGYFWVATAAGTFLGEAVQVGDSLIATVDEAGASIGDWLILQGNVVIATDTVDGIVRLATQAEVDAGTEGGAVVVTPATLQVKVDAAIATAESYADGVALTAENNAKAYADSLAPNYDAAGSATTAENNAKAYADSLAPNYDAAGSATTAENNAKAYADSLAPNYDAAGAAATAESNANSYTDSAISQEVTDRNAAIATAKGEAIADANSYTDGEIAQEVIDRDAAIATAKSEAIADANAYTDSQLAASVFNGAFANTDWNYDAGKGFYYLDVVHNINSLTPKVSVYDSATNSLVEFSIDVNDNNSIQLKSNIAAPASVNVGVSK